MVTLLYEIKQQKEQKLGNIAKPQHNETQIMLTEFCPVLTWRANTLDLLLQDELAELEVVPRLKVQRIHRPNRPGQSRICFYCCGCCLVWNCACPTMSWPDSILSLFYFNWRTHEHEECVFWVWLVLPSCQSNVSVVNILWWKSNTCIWFAFFISFLYCTHHDLSFSFLFLDQVFIFINFPQLLPSMWRKRKKKCTMPWCWTVWQWEIWSKRCVKFHILHEAVLTWIQKFLW